MDIRIFIVKKKYGRPYFLRSGWERRPIGPLDRGGAAIEIVALDGRTGEALASMKKGCYPRIWDFTARFAKLEPAQLALKCRSMDLT